MRARINGSKAVAFLSALLILSAPLTLLIIAPSASGAPDQGIDIEGNAELRAIASEMGWPGVGSMASPFVISDLDLVAAGGAPAISLTGTDLHVQITGTNISSDGNGVGISLTRASNVLIDNCRFDGLGTAVDLISSQHITLSESIISNSTTGFRAVDSRLCTLIDSVFSHNDRSIELVTSSSNLIEDNVLSQSNNGTVILLVSSSENILRGNALVGGRCGIELAEARSNQLRSNTLKDMSVGILLGDLSAGNFLRQNVLANMTQDAIEIRSSTSNRLYQNAMTGCSILITGDRAAFSSQTIPENNTVNGRAVVYLKGLVDPAPLNARTVGQLILGDVVGLTVNKYIVNGGSLGMCLGYCERVTISNSTLTGNDRGIIALSCSNLTLYKNTYVSNQIGLMLVRSDGCASVDEVHSTGGKAIIIEEGSCHEVRGASMDETEVGVMADMTYDLTVHECLISLADIGVWLLSSPRASVHENQFDGCRVGALVEGNGTVELNGNVHQGGIEGTRVLNSTGVTLVGAIYDAVDIAFWSDNSTSTIVDCTVQDGGSGFVLNDTDGTHVFGCHFTGLNDEAIKVLGGRNVSLTSNHISNSSGGIRLEGTMGANLSDNTVVNISGDGIVSIDVQGTIFDANRVQGCFHGIYLMDSNDNALSGNDLSLCHDGLSLFRSADNLIVDNAQLGNSRYGISIISSDGNIIASNNISSNLDQGLCLIDSDSNIIHDNDLARNLGAGVLILSGTGNVFFDNAFFSNNGAGTSYSMSRAQASDHGHGNEWSLDGDTPRGNFWSDLTGPDADNDTVVEIPYALAGPAGSLDHYPLTFPSITVPEAPQHLVGLGRNGRTWMAWEPPQQDGHSPVLNYTVYRAVGDDNMQPYASLGGGVTEFIDEDVTDGQTYRYEVRARNIIGEGEPTATLVVRPMSGPMVAHGNDELRQLATLMGWSGDGSAASPFMVTGLNVAGGSDQTILALVGTDLHLIIDNMTFERYSNGGAISLFRVSNLSITNTSFLNGGTAIEAIACRDIQVRDCSFEGNDVAVRTWLVTESDLLRCSFTSNNASLLLHSSDRIRVEGCALQSPSGRTAITLTSSSDNWLKDNDISGGEAGIVIDSSIEIDLVGNGLHDLDTGIVLDDLSTSTFMDGNAFMDIEGDGLWIKNASSTTMFENTFLGCSMAITGDERAFADNEIAANNTVNGGLLVYLNGEHDGTIFSNTVVGELIVGGTEDLSVVNVTVLPGGSLGIAVGHSVRTEVSGCTLSGLDIGMSLRGCMDASLSGNEYGSDLVGLEMVQCSDSLSTGEGFDACSIGMAVRESEGIQVLEAATEDCTMGISVEHSRLCQVNDSIASFDGVGCSVEASEGIALHGNQWSGCEVGVLLTRDAGSVVGSNSLELCLVGIELRECDGTSLGDNRFEACATGVLVNQSHAVAMTGDRHSNGSVAVRIQQGDNNSVTTCVIDHMPSGVVLEQSSDSTVSGCDVSHCSEEAMLVVGGKGNSLESNNIHDTSRGLHLLDTMDGMVRKNSLSDIEEYAIMLNATQGCTIADNLVSDCFLGAVLLDSDSNLLLNNTVQGCFDGTLLRGSDENRIISNDQLWSSRYGIVLFDSDENDMSFNNISFSSNYGLGLFGSDRNIISTNDMMENVGPAISIQSGDMNLLCDNAFFSNNGASSSYQASHVQVFDAGNGTSWYATNGTRSFGNFWSDWTAPDADRDSIVDSPYLLVGSDSSDPYPLTSPNLAHPSTPRSLEGLGRNATVRLSWSSPADEGDARILNYTVYRAEENGTMDTYAVLGNVTEFLDDNVTNGANYTYSVSATNLMGEGPRSYSVLVTPIGVTFAPRNLTANATAQYVLLNWTEPIYLGGSDTTSYQLYRGTSSGNLTWLADVDALEYNDTEVANGLTYYYAVVGVNEAGPGNWSEETNATVPVVPPFAPAHVQAVLQGSIAIVNWSAPTFDGGATIEGYNVYRSENGVWTSSPYGFTNASTTTFADQLAQYGSSYVYAVAAYQVAGEGQRAESGVVVPTTIPGAPTDLEATILGTGNDAVTLLSWTAPSFDGGTPILGYVVLRGMSDEPMEELARVSGTTYSDEEVIDIATYIYAIQAYNAVGDGEVSEEVVAKNTRTVFGRVLNNAGDPVPNATVTIDGRSDTTDSTGLFTLEVLPGDQIIQIESDQGSLEEEISIGLDSSYLGDFIVEEEEGPLEFLGLFWMWWLLIIGLCVVVPLVLLLLRRR